MDTTFDNISLQEFVELCTDWKTETNPDLSNIQPTSCPVHQYFIKKAQSCRTTVQTIKNCPICNNPCCPECYNHNVTQLSRVTGYMSSVSGWNEAKKEELKDRHRVML